MQESTKNPPAGRSPSGGNPLSVFRKIMVYFAQVRSEGRKVTWPSRQETTVSTIAVFIMVFLAAVFLYLSDQILAWVVRLVLGLGG